MKIQPAEIILVSISSKSQKDESELTAYYQEKFIPNLLQVVPEIATAKRYTKIDNVDTPTTWTIYKITVGSTAEKAKQAIKTRPGREPHQKWWRQEVMPNKITSFGRPTAFQPLFYDANGGHKLWNSKPFLALQHKVQNADVKEFETNLQKLCNEIKASAPDEWICYHSYKASTADDGSEQYLTVFEAIDEPSFQAALRKMPFKSNQDQQSYHTDQSLFAPIFSCP